MSPSPCIPRTLSSAATEQGGHTRTRLEGTSRLKSSTRQEQRTQEPQELTPFPCALYFTVYEIRPCQSVTCWCLTPIKASYHDYQDLLNWGAPEQGLGLLIFLIPVSYAGPGKQQGTQEVEKMNFISGETGPEMLRNLPTVTQQKTAVLPGNKEKVGLPQRR